MKRRGALLVSSPAFASFGISMAKSANSMVQFPEMPKLLAPASRFAGFEMQAPILVLPNVFEHEFCKKLIALHETHGSEESGFMRDVNGKTVQLHDYGHKRRRDHI